MLGKKSDKASWTILQILLLCGCSFYVEPDQMRNMSRRYNFKKEKNDDRSNKNQEREREKKNFKKEPKQTGNKHKISKRNWEEYRDGMRHNTAE